MTKSASVEHENFILPPTIVSKVDVSRLVHEVEQVDSILSDAALRTGTHGSAHIKPTLSDQLNEFLKYNELTIGTSRERTSLIKELRLLKDKAPVVHMTFATTADRESLEYLVGWLRASIHKQSIVTVGVQPSLIGGVYVRTPNHVHDFSLRNKLKGQHELLLKELRALTKDKKHV